ncbi:MAG: metallophosphoesterase [Nitrososphaeraceae archaeon]
MSRIQYILMSSSILILATLFVSVALSQNVTNQSNVNSSIIADKINKSIDVTVIDTVGDLDCSNNLDEQIKKDNPDLFIALGDLCYKSDLSNFTGTYGDLKKEGKFACVMGNHEDEKEEGNPILDKQTSQYCNDHWYRKIANNTTLLIGLNTNGDTKLQTKWGQSVVTNSTLMKGIKNIMLISHKPALTPPESHHPARNSTIRMISGIESNITKGIQIYEIAAHNHFMAESSNGRWFITGAGGKSHYEGATSEEWPFVNTMQYGYLQIRISNTNGTVISSNFYGLDGKLIR